jgi:hypothetical protein
MLSRWTLLGVVTRWRQGWSCSLRCLQIHLLVFLFRPAGRQAARGNCLVLCFRADVHLHHKDVGAWPAGRSPRQLLVLLPRALCCSERGRSQLVSVQRVSNILLSFHVVHCLHMCCMIFRIVRIKAAGGKLPMEFNEVVGRHAGRDLTADAKELSQRRNACGAICGMFTFVQHVR